MKKIVLTSIVFFAQIAYSHAQCPEDVSSTQKAICAANMSYTESVVLLNKHYEQLLSIFDQQIKEENYIVNFKEMKSSLVSSQAAWLAYIESQCLYKNSIESSTSGAPELEYICKEEFIKERSAFLLNEIEEWKDGSLK